jgi:hypothetical protein
MTKKYQIQEIPPEARLAATEAHLRTGGCIVSTVLAALNAWPGADIYEANSEPYYGRNITLPLGEKKKMTPETDKQFVERMIAETPVLHSLNTERLLALALRGAETQWRPITEEDREWIEVRAAEMYRKWDRSMGSVRGQVIRPEDNIMYWTVDATLERFIPLTALGEPK